MALVPTVFRIPDAILTPHAIAAISTRLSVVCCPISTSEAMYSATLGEGLSYVDNNQYKSKNSPQISGCPGQNHGNGIDPSSTDCRGGQHSDLIKIGK